MKSLKFLMVLCLACLITSGRPAYNYSTGVSFSKSLPDLSQDEVFVRTVNEILAVKSKITEKGFNDASLDNSFYSIGTSILALKNKYAELNNEAASASIFELSIQKMQQQGQIVNFGNKKSTAYHVCLQLLFAAIGNCVTIYHQTHNWGQLVQCVQAAFTQFNNCLNH